MSQLSVMYTMQAFYDRKLFRPLKQHGAHLKGFQSYFATVLRHKHYYRRLFGCPQAATRHE